jgi:hypothetical protein
MEYSARSGQPTSIAAVGPDSHEYFAQFGNVV